MKKTRSTARQETLLQSTANRHMRRKVPLVIVRSQRVEMWSLEKVTNRQEKLSTTDVRNQPQEVTPQTFRRERLLTEWRTLTTAKLPKSSHWEALITLGPGCGGFNNL